MKPEQMPLDAPVKADALARNTPMDLLAIALQKDAAIDVIERLAKLQMESRKMDAEIDFNEALNQCQQEVQMVVADSDKTAPGGKKWATYKALDRAIRPIYTKHGFSLSFGTSECGIPNHILVTCLVSRGIHTRSYQLPMDVSGKGPQGGGALSGPHAILAGMEYGRRCLLKSIFNLVTGDEDALTNGELMERVEWIENCRSIEELMNIYKEARDAFETNVPALKVLKEAKDKRKKELQ